jgi:pyruvate dehydrogenase E2 component (dihydrolipoamide acetyltransferase)
MPHILRMPEVAAASTEAVLAEWLVAENAEFAANDAIATVETDKALVDIEAEVDGVVLKTLVLAGVLVEVGTPIAVLGSPGEEVADMAALIDGLGVAEPVAPVVPERRDVDPPATTEAVESAVPSRRIFSSPLARKLASAAEIPVDEINGSGPRGRILRRDVEAAIAARAPASPTPPTAAPPTATTPPAPSPMATGIPHTRLRKAIARRLVESKQTAPHFYVRATVRADRLVALRADLNDGAAVKVSLNDLVVKAVAAAHLDVPQMNVIWTTDAVRTFETVDVAIAVATERGLVTPVLRDVPALSVSAVAAQVRDLASRAREGRLKQDEVEGGTISITNLGMHGVEEFAAIINPPHAAILAVGAVRDEPVVEDGAVVPGQVMSVTLSADHRPIDGVVAARWLAALKELLEHPVRILA